MVVSLTILVAAEISLTHFENEVPVLQVVLKEINLCQDFLLVERVRDGRNARHPFDFLIRAKPLRSAWAHNQWEE